MVKRIIVCDHCGKEIDAFDDYTDVEFSSFYDGSTTDLCQECFQELNDIVLQYLNKK